MRSNVKSLCLAIVGASATTVPNKPVLLRIDHDAGHRRDSNRSQFEQESADPWSHASWQTSEPGFQPRVAR